jgi:hypothetical protein
VARPWPWFIKPLFKRVVLFLGSLHLSLMAALGIWLWSHPTTFGNSEPCAIKSISIIIIGNRVPFSSAGLHVASLVIYSIFLVPGLNLVIPMVAFLGLYIGYQVSYQQVSCFNDMGITACRVWRQKVTIHQKTLILLTWTLLVLDRYNSGPDILCKPSGIAFTFSALELEHGATAFLGPTGASRRLSPAWPRF